MRTARPGRQWWRWLGVAVPAVLAAVIAGWALWPRPAAAPPQARQYLEVTACLLTGPSGVTPGAPAAPAWAAMEQASLATHVMVSYLSAVPAAVPVLLNTLVQRRCGLIVAAGAPLAQVARAARTHPGQRFLVVGSAGAIAAAAPANAAVVSAPAAPGRIGQALRALAAAA